jgi:outer membrane receptor for ferrienterochelin and colicins
MKRTLLLSHTARTARTACFALIAFAALTTQALAQTATLEGTVVSESGEPIPFASVGIRGTALGAAASLDGSYRIEDLPAGEHTVIASAVGFRSATEEIRLEAGQVLRVDLALTESVLETEGVVVTGTMQETYVSESPVKVSVVSARYLEKIPTANVMDVLQNVNGLYEQIDCAVCVTNNIRINGMDGPYTAVLIDGMPIMSSLATVYGLNGISPALIQQVEVIKGPMSTLYGSEALGGVINIITKNPRTAPRLSVNTFATSHGEYAADVGIARTSGRLASLFSGTLFYNSTFHDDNADGFADTPLNTRVSLFGKAALANREGLRQADFSARYYYEDRLAGVEGYIDNFSDALRGSSEVYGETIRTHRVEAVGSYHLAPRAGVKLDAAFNHHDQDSYYGADSYQATQTTAFAQLVAPARLGQRHSALFGAALRAQRYDDNTGATGDFDEAGAETQNRPDDRVIPGVFAQHEWVASGALRTLVGLRVDYQEDYGVIPSPRVSLKLRPREATTLRLNVGTGFRIVNLFTEDHAAYTGARATVLLEDLRPERSVSGTASLQHTIAFGANPLTIDLEGFYTVFSNKIEPNYDTPGLILYQNLDGSAITRGASLTLSQSMTAIPLTYTLGATWMDVFTEDGTGEDRAREPLEFAPDFQGIANATLRLPRGFALDYTMNLTGPMRLPEYDAPFERPTTSPTFAVHNLQLTKDFTLHRGPLRGDLIQAYVAAENFLDYTQDDALIDPANPFGDRFDTAYVYGPLHGSCVGLGLRVMMR